MVIFTQVKIISNLARPGEKTEKRQPKGMNKKIYNEQWFAYIAKCRDGRLYVGIAKDVSRRINEHNTTIKCRYTRYRKPVELLYKEKCTNYNIARKRELEIKRFSKKKKFALIASSL